MYFFHAISESQHAPKTTYIIGTLFSNSRNQQIHLCQLRFKEIFSCITLTLVEKHIAISLSSVNVASAPSSISFKRSTDMPVNFAMSSIDFLKISLIFLVRFFLYCLKAHPTISQGNPLSLKYVYHNSSYL